MALSPYPPCSDLQHEGRIELDLLARIPPLVRDEADRAVVSFYCPALSLVSVPPDPCVDIEASKSSTRSQANPLFIARFS